MLPQPRGALTDAAAARSLHPHDGCHVPRFIERDLHHAISLHVGLHHRRGRGNPLRRH